MGIRAEYSMSCASGEQGTRALYASLGKNVKQRCFGTKTSMCWEVTDRQAQRDLGAADDGGAGPGGGVANG